MKKLRPKAHIDELCYPFMYEDSHMCDYEIVTDKLTRMVGWAVYEVEALLDSANESQHQNSIAHFQLILQHLNWIQPMCYHINGSIRGKLAVEDSDHEVLLEMYREIKEITQDQLSGFVLPRGNRAVGILNQCSSLSKEAIRWMVRIHNQEGKEVHQILPKFANVLCNYFFTATLVINMVEGIEEIPFDSKSYWHQSQQLAVNPSVPRGFLFYYGL